MGYNLKIFYVEYQHNNSGGFDWMNKEDWKKLFNNGWKPYIVSDDYIHSAYKKFKAKNENNAYKNARKNWRKITNYNPNAIGCLCCGQPHTFKILDVEDIEEIEEGEKTVS